jgi:hypothetical protein
MNKYKIEINNQIDGLNRFIFGDINQRQAKKRRHIFDNLKIIFNAKPNFFLLKNFIKTNIQIGIKNTPFRNMKVWIETTLKYGRYK